MFGWWNDRRRRKIAAQGWPADWDLHLNRNVRLTWNLTELEIALLKHRVKIFVAEKDWEGIDGFQVTTEMKVTIAAQACLMLLGIDNFYFDNVKTVILFPHSFERRSKETGEHSYRAGEAWLGGPIILSWQDSLRGGRNEDDGQNLVIHEFAHALDGLDGDMGGQVEFSDPETSRKWRQLLDYEYHELREAEIENKPTLLDHYGAINKAEFFAVATETFFELPHALHKEKRSLFDFLKTYYQVEPRNWQRIR